MAANTPGSRPDSGPDSGPDDREEREDDHRERRSEGPERAPDLAELIRYLAVNLVDRPDEVRVELVEERTANVYELEVAEADLGKVIGRGGKTARALRTVVQAVAPRSRKRTLVEILE
jgi:predicted RNA-binding protein YlqC (UPF0109 family)